MGFVVDYILSKLVDKLYEFFKKQPLMAIGALVGGINVLTFIDSFFQTIFKIPLPGIPPDVLQFFAFFRELWRPVTDFIAALVPFELPAAMKDYLTMGFITAGMRFRSSMIIWNAVNNQSLTSYRQRTILPGKPVALRSGEWCKFLFIFLPVRLTYAFIAWPSKIWGATYRYYITYIKPSQPEDPNFKGESERAVREEQYMAFFVTIVLALILLLFIYVIALLYFMYSLALSFS